MTRPWVRQQMSPHLFQPTRWTHHDVKPASEPRPRIHSSCMEGHDVDVDCCPMGSEDRMGVETGRRTVFVAQAMTRSPLRHSRACIRMSLARTQWILSVEEGRMSRSPVPKLASIRRRRSEAQSMRVFWRRRRLGVLLDRFHGAVGCDQASLRLFSAAWMLRLCVRDLRGQWSRLRPLVLLGLDIAVEGAESCFCSAWA